MLLVTVPSTEAFNDATMTFVSFKAVNFQIEHSLVSISKWESVYQKPFLGDTDKTVEETKAYIRCMTVSKNIDPEVYDRLTDENYTSIKNYISSPMTATWFNEQSRGGRSREVITSEIIYYWMVAHNIPFECQKWHLNRLITLIRVCNIKNQPPAKKRGGKDALVNRRALNEARRNKLNSKG